MSTKEIIYKTYLIYGNNPELRREKIQMIFPEKFQRGNNPDYLEIKLSDKKKSIGIEEVKSIGQFLQTKPISHRVKIALISDSNSLTTEAQNSLLKILEEHTNNSIIILEDSYINFILPTIISRCILEKVQNQINTNLNVPENFFEMDIREKLNYFETINKLEKDEIIQLLNNSFQLLKEERFQKYKEINSKNINLISTVCENLEKYNLNTRLALENLALNLIPVMI